MSEEMALKRWLKRLILCQKIKVKEKANSKKKEKANSKKEEIMIRVLTVHLKEQPNSKKTGLLDEQANSKKTGLLDEQADFIWMMDEICQGGGTVCLQKRDEEDLKIKNKLLELGYSKRNYGDDADAGWKPCLWQQVSRVLQKTDPTVLVNLLVKPYVKITDFNLHLKLQQANLLLCVPKADFKDSKESLGFYPTRIAFYFEPCWPHSRLAVPAINLDRDSEESSLISPYESEGKIGFVWRLKSEDTKGRPELPFKGTHPNLNHVFEVRWALTRAMLGSDLRHPLELKGHLEYDMQQWHSTSTSQSYNKLCFSLNISANLFNQELPFFKTDVAECAHQGEILAML